MHFSGSLLVSKENISRLLPLPFLLHPADGFFDDGVGKAAALQGSHHKVSAADGQLFAVAAVHQRGGGFQLRVIAILRGVDCFQRTCHLGGGKPLLAQALGGGAAALRAASRLWARASA